MSIFLKIRMNVFMYDGSKPTGKNIMIYYCLFHLASCKNNGSMLKLYLQLFMCC